MSRGNCIAVMIIIIEQNSHDEETFIYVSCDKYVEKARKTMIMSGYSCKPRGFGKYNIYDKVNCLLLRWLCQGLEERDLSGAIIWNNGDYKYYEYE